MANTSSEVHSICNDFFSQYHSPEETIKWYATWAESYDQDLSKLTHGYNHPRQIAEVTAETLGDFKDAKILDVGAGTGLGGVELVVRGFKNVSALDGSQAMLDRAKAKNIYREYFCEMIGEHPLANIPDAQYDCITSSGTFVEGHLDYKCLRTISRPLKSGGYLVMSLREEYLTQVKGLHELEPTMKAMEAEGFWKIIRWETVPNYFDNKSGKLYVFQRN